MLGLGVWARVRFWVMDRFRIRVITSFSVSFRVSFRVRARVRSRGRARVRVRVRVRD